MVFLYTTVCRPPGGGLRILFPAKILGQQEQGTKTTELTLSLCLRMSHRNLAYFGQNPVYKKLDLEKGFG